MRSFFHSVLMTTAGLAALTGVGMSSAHADAIPYPNAGTVAPANSFSAANTGDLVAYFYGSTASFTETLGLLVNNVVRASGIFPNKSTSNGDTFNFGPVTAGDTLTFFINVDDNGQTFYSDPSRNSDGLNHVYTTSFSGGTFGIPAGTFVGFEDQTNGGDLNYNDETFVFTNTASMSTVPLPASAPMFGAAVLALGLAGYGLKRKKALAA